MFLYSSAVEEGGMCIPTFVDFFLFHLFFLCFSRFLFLFSLSRRLQVLMAFFFLLFPFVCQLLSISSADHFQFLFIRSLYPGHGTICNVTHSPPSHFRSVSSTIPLLTAGDQVVAEGVTHISCYHTRIRSGGQGKIKQTNKHEQSLGLAKSKKEVLQHYISVCGLSLAWVTSENSTSTGMPTSFDSIFFAGPYLVCHCLRSPVLTAPVRGSTPTLCCSPLCCPTPTALVWVPRQLPARSFVQPTLIHVPLPLPDTARFQVQESFVWFRTKTDKGIVCIGGLPI